MAPVPPNEVTPDKEDEPEEEEQPCDDDLIEQALDEVEDITIEKLIGVGMMVRIRMFRLSKRECAAVGAREAIDSRYGRPWNKDRNELDSERFAFGLCCGCGKAQSAISTASTSSGAWIIARVIKSLPSRVVAMPFVGVDGAICATRGVRVTRVTFAVGSWQPSAAFGGE